MIYNNGWNCLWTKKDLWIAASAYADVHGSNESCGHIFHLHLA
jgi:hypothetical protein